MARIIHVGAFSLRAKGAFQHSVEHKLSNGLTRNGHQVVNFSDRDAARSGSLLGVKWGGRGRANQALRAFCRDLGPEIMILGHADVIEAETVDQIREDLPGLRILQWNVDPLFESDNIRRLEAKLEVVDATLVSTAGEALRPLSRPGRRLGFLPNPVDFSIERGLNHLRADLAFDLFYACGNPGRPLREVCGALWDMNAFMTQLLAGLPQVRALTPGIGDSPLLAGAPYQTALEQAALGLNISRRDDNLLYSSDRLAHMSGNGQAVLIARSTGYDSLFSDDEMVFFDSLEGLGEAIARLVADPARRMAIAAAGRERYHALFNERIVARYLVDVALDRLDPAAYAWPTLID